MTVKARKLYEYEYIQVVAMLAEGYSIRYIAKTGLGTRHQVERVVINLKEEIQYYMNHNQGTLSDKQIADALIMDIRLVEKYR